jgi:hypothetical protein
MLKILKISLRDMLLTPPLMHTNNRILLHMPKKIKKLRIFYKKYQI